MITRLCGRIVEACGSEWGFIGWMLFAGVFVVPLLAGESDSEAVVIICVTLLLLTVVWWIVDIVYQHVPLWIILAGVIMIVGGTLVGVGFFTIICWILYWTKVRE